MNILISIISAVVSNVISSYIVEWLNSRAMTQPRLKAVPTYKQHSPIRFAQG